jgi:ABC-2 type transport system permease protein
MMIFTIAWRELKNLFLSPLAWVALAVLQWFLALTFLQILDQVIRQRAQLLALATAPGITELIVPSMFRDAAIVLLLITPLLTMRLIAEERRGRTLPLLFSAPISMTQIVLGKYLGVVMFLALVVLLMTLMPLSLMAGGQVDLGLLAIAMLGLLLTLASFAAIGLFVSTLTQHVIVAAVGAMGLTLFFWLADWTGQGDPHASTLAYLSLFNHYWSFLRGYVDTTSVAYYVLFITTFLVLSIRRLDGDRLGG